ncbi:class I SAM-dependent methyltransferase [Arthrobacter sp. PAMC25284]|uniref:class I SAM-dependent methyltransferase n=1 Tax=Arthrobacter sp. PAMC25284 TaxID=2861279 RepID=UPI001C639B50|nr:methyltransferase domain-containing protein [Arthrobacter sp. PAMC25284]QYF89109.1 methyltransferase domain-containing protein [Arthrobacter sp. PAMC25284]
MSAASDRIPEQQRKIWDQFSAGWRKWDAEVLGWHGPVGDAMIEDARLRPDARIIDIASGTGEPGLTAAAMVPSGHVILMDISTGMLRVAAEKAESRGLDNVRTVVCDVTELPFGDKSFDTVFCRFGFMFFPEMSAALAELVRVAKPGGRIVASVWARAAENPWASLILGTIARHSELPFPPADAPGPFRCAAHGYMSRFFTGAGLVDVSERKISSDMVQPSPETYWEFMTDIAAPVVLGLSKADPAAREMIRSEVFQMLSRYEHDGAIRLRSTAAITAGTVA